MKSLQDCEVSRRREVDLDIQDIMSFGSDSGREVSWQRVEKSCRICYSQRFRALQGPHPWLPQCRHREHTMPLK